MSSGSEKKKKLECQNAGNNACAISEKENQTATYGAFPSFPKKPFPLVAVLCLSREVHACDLHDLIAG